MPHKIEKPIVAWKIVNKEEPSAIEIMHEGLKRPEFLRGTTYKLKHPASEHALYVTINDMVLNVDTPDQRHYPYEIFLHSKNMDSFQWITALTRVISAVFRKGGDTLFLIEELKSTFDPRGGYFKGRTYMPSIVADIGHILERHLKHIGHIPEADEEQEQLIQKLMEEKEFALRDKGGDIEFPESSILCEKCNVKAVVKMDGCMTCLNCGDSKCQ